MYGKHYESLYEGSMIGSGAIVFAVWGYVIAKQKPDRTYGSQVCLNPKLLSPILGESEKDIVAAIQYLCSPDPQSRTKEHEGRRLIKLGEFDYQVVTGAKYRAIRSAEERRESNRIYQQRSRARKAAEQNPLPGEAAAERLAREGATQEEIDRFQEKTLPEPE